MTSARKYLSIGIYTHTQRPEPWIYVTNENNKSATLKTAHNTVAWACALYVRQSFEKTRKTNIINNHLAIKSDAISCTNKYNTLKYTDNHMHAHVL